MAKDSKKHPGFKKTGDGNGLFAEMHPSWTRKTGLAAVLEEALRGSTKNPQLGVISSPAANSVGE